MRLIGWLNEWVTERLIHLLLDPLIDWLIDWLFVWLVDFSTDRLIEWLIDLCLFRKGAMPNNSPIQHYLVIVEPQISKFDSIGSSDVFLPLELTTASRGGNGDRSEEQRARQRRIRTPDNATSFTVTSLVPFTSYTFQLIAVSRRMRGGILIRECRYRAPVSLEEEEREERYLTGFSSIHLIHFFSSGGRKDALQLVTRI